MKKSNGGVKVRDNAQRLRNMFVNNVVAYFLIGIRNSFAQLFVVLPHRRASSKSKGRCVFVRGVARPLCLPIGGQKGEPKNYLRHLAEGFAAPRDVLMISAILNEDEKYEKTLIGRVGLALIVEGIFARMFQDGVSCFNTVLLWSRGLVALFYDMKKSITKMVLEMIIALRTLNFGLKDNPVGKELKTCLNMLTGLLNVMTLA